MLEEIPDIFPDKHVQVASTMAIKRLTTDYKHLISDPLPSITAHPLPENILEWHYLIYGSEDTPYEGGYYHGKLVFPCNFPMGPPTIIMFTPSGRFYPDTRLCLSISDYHPEKWNPAWTVSAILMGLMTFMNENSKTSGSMETTEDLKRELAKTSMAFNLNNPLFCRIFPEMVEMFLHEDSSSEGEFEDSLDE